MPGDQVRRLERAAGRGADALIVDLEDAVAPRAKPEARRIVARWLTSLDPGGEGGAPVEVWVRVNAVGSRAGADLHEDIAAVVVPGIAGVCLAKAQSAGDVAVLHELLAAAEARAGMAEGALAVSPLIETARGVLDAPAIAASPRVERLQIGEADLSAELGLAPGPDEAELLALRTQVVVASAAAGIGAPVGPVSTNFTDLDTFREGTERLKRLGFSGRAVIHPAQVSVVHQVFTASPEELRRARDLVDRFDAAVAAGSGLALDEGGQMVDEAVVRAARALLAREEPLPDGG